MKIHSNDHLPGLPQAVSKAKGGAPSPGFADVLANTLKPTAPAPAPAAGIGAPVRIMRPMDDKALSDEVVRTTDRLLDVMERYRALLADSAVNLREVAPALGDIQSEMASLEPLMGGLSEDHAVLKIARQAMLAASKEIARFNGGDYVDE